MFKKFLKNKKLKDANFVLCPFFYTLLFILNKVFKLLLENSKYRVEIYILSLSHAKHYLETFQCSR